MTGSQDGVTIDNNVDMPGELSRRLAAGFMGAVTGACLTGIAIYWILTFVPIWLTMTPIPFMLVGAVVGAYVAAAHLTSRTWLKVLALSSLATGSVVAYWFIFEFFMYEPFWRAWS